MRAIGTIAALVALGLPGCGDGEPSCDGPGMTGVPQWNAAQPTIGDGTMLSVIVPVTTDALVVSVTLSKPQPLTAFPQSAGIGSAMNGAGAAEVVVPITVNTRSSGPGTYFLQVQVADRTGVDPSVRGATYVLLDPSDTQYTLICARSPTPQPTGIPVSFVTVQ